MVSCGTAHCHIDCVGGTGCGCIGASNDPVDCACWCEPGQVEPPFTLAARASALGPVALLDADLHGATEDNIALAVGLGEVTGGTDGQAAPPYRVPNAEAGRSTTTKAFTRIALAELLREVGIQPPGDRHPPAAPA